MTDPPPYNPDTLSLESLTVEELGLPDVFTQKVDALRSRAPTVGIVSLYAPDESNFLSHVNLYATLLTLLHKNPFITYYEHPADLTSADLIVLTGFDRSLMETGMDQFANLGARLDETEAPVLGICGGMQYYLHTFGAGLAKNDPSGENGTYHGLKELYHDDVALSDPTFAGFDQTNGAVWANHNEHVDLAGVEGTTEVLAVHEIHGKRVPYVVEHEHNGKRALLSQPHFEKRFKTMAEQRDNNAGMLFLVGAMHNLLFYRR